jgi:ParB family transcriptional regulator, chromosome partitioning protein
MPETIVQDIAIDLIQSRPQVRRVFDEQCLKELAENIREVGVQQPIRVRADGPMFTILFGERRWRAAKLAGLPVIPAIVSNEQADPADGTLLQLTENLQRCDLTACEKSQAIQHFMEEAKLTAAQAGRKLGLSAAMVTRLLSLAKLPASILEEVERGAINLSSAYELSQVADPQRQKWLADQVRNGELKREGLARARSAPPQASQSAGGVKSMKRLTAKLDDGLSVIVIGEGMDSLDQYIACVKELLAKAQRARTRYLTLGTFLKTLADSARSPAPITAGNGQV